MEIKDQNNRYWGLIDHSWDGKQIVNLALLVYREGLHEDSWNKTNSCLAGNLSWLYYFNISINNSKSPSQMMKNEY
jgi:hypothetical protein